jgi:hypothetical protein
MSTSTSSTTAKKPIFVRVGHKVLEVKRPGGQASDAVVLYSQLQQFDAEQFAPGCFKVDLSHLLRVLSAKEVPDDCW